MLTRFSVWFRSAALSVAVIWSLPGFTSGLRAETNELQKAETSADKNNILKYRAYRPSDSIFKSSGVNVPTTVVPQPSAPPRNTRQERELLDREKNWIFVLPGDTRKNDSAEDLLGVGALKGDEEAKSVLTKFLENQNNDDSSAIGDSPSSFHKDRVKTGTTPIFGLGTEKPAAFGAWSPLAAKPGNGLGNPEPTLAERWKEMNSPKAEKMREQRRVQMSEFQSLFSPQNPISPNGGFGQLNNQNLLGLSASTPAQSSGPDIFNRAAPISPTPSKIIAPRAASSDSFAGPVDINVRTFGPSAVISPTPEPSRSVSQPVNLPIPKRHF